MSNKDPATINQHLPPPPHIVSGYEMLHLRAVAERPITKMADLPWHLLSAAGGNG